MSISVELLTTRSVTGCMHSGDAANECSATLAQSSVSASIDGSRADKARLARPRVGRGRRRQQRGLRDQVDDVQLPRHVAPLVVVVQQQRERLVAFGLALDLLGLARVALVAARARRLGRDLGRLLALEEGEHRHVAAVD
eukprot:6649387-Prymnesium_polylepis.1